MKGWCVAFPPKDVVYAETKHQGAGPIIIVVGEFDMAGTEVF
jgi:hypothetical protein